MDMVQGCNSSPLPPHPAFYFLFLFYANHIHTKKHSSKMIYPPNQHKVVQLKTHLQQPKHYKLVAREHSLRLIYFFNIIIIILVLCNP